MDSLTSRHTVREMALLSLLPSNVTIRGVTLSLYPQILLKIKGRGLKVICVPGGRNLGDHLRILLSNMHSSLAGNWQSSVLFEQSTHENVYVEVPLKNIEANYKKNLF